MTEQDPMDQRLREYADRWRASSASVPAPDVDRLPARSTRRTWWVAGVAAAAVVAGIALGTTLVGHDDVATPPRPAHTVKPGGVVPWAPLPATHPTIPTETTPPSPDPAEAAGKPECRAADLRAENGGLDGAAGTVYLTARLVLVGSTPCRLEGWPGIEPMDAGHPADIPVARTTDSSVYRHAVLVAPGQPAVLFLAWSSNWCTTPVHNDAIRMVAPGGFVDLPGFGSSPDCSGVAGSGPSPIMVQPFRPENTRERQVRSAYAEVEVSGDLQLTSAPNRQVHFTVTLTSPRDVPLTPCPDYRIAEFGGAHDSDTSYGLNCDAVPYRDSAGRPYLPAGTPVRFDMGAYAGSQSVPKLIWELVVPEREKSLGGRITVTASAASPTATSPASTGPADPAALADPKTVRSATSAIQTFLDTWRRDGMVVAARRYFDAASQPGSAAGLPRISYGKVVHAAVSSWESADHFTLEVELDLHFTANRFAWDEGRNDRFITLTRDGGGFRLDFATSP